MPTVPIEGGDLFYEDQGSGPPLVFVHGGWQNARSWERQLARFADEYRVITYDIRGHGRTGPTDIAEYSIELFADDLETLLVHLDIERPILVGMSVGGMITREFLSRHPDTARAAVIGGPFQSLFPAAVPTEFPPFLSPTQALDQVVATLGSSGTFRSLLSSMRATNGGPWLALDSDVRSEAVDAAGDVRRGEYSKIFGAIYDYDPVDLSGIETPVLVLYGEDESPQIKRQGEQLAADVPDGSYRELPGGAHLINQDNPEGFNDACASFFVDLAVQEPEMTTD